MLHCTWPSLLATNEDPFVLPGENDRPVKVLLLADTHIISHNSWLEKITRQWRIQRAFRTSMFLHNPDVVIHLGDVVDLGWSQSDSELKDELSAFREIFYLPSSSKTALKIVAGNHDVGFTSKLHEHKYERFWNALRASDNYPAVKMWINRGLIFVFLNRFPVDDDEKCDMCTYADLRLGLTAKRLSCLNGELSIEECMSQIDFSAKEDLVFDNDSEILQPGSYSRPILIQHFPLHRSAKSICPTLPSQDYSSFSRNVSENVLRSIHPRLVFDGHLHYECNLKHNISDDNNEISAEEWTLPPFSFVQIYRPGFLMLHVSANNYAVRKCYLPSEIFILLSYVIGFAAILLLSCRSSVYRVSRRRYLRLALS